MGKKANHYLVVYDIRDTRRLQKVEKITEGYCYRMQNSVMASNADENSIKQMKETLEQTVTAEDFVLIFQICEKDFQKIEMYGKCGADDPMNDSFMIL